MSNIMYRQVGADFEKPKIYISIHNEEGKMKRGIQKM